MHQLRRQAAGPVRAGLRTLTVLLACLGLGSVSLAAAGGSASTDPGGAVLAAARAHVGDGYAWGDEGPKTWDCSGLTSTLWRQVGGVKGVPRVSRDQHAWAVPLPVEQVLPGDLVFFGNPVTHVGIAASRITTKGVTMLTMVDASSSKNGVVERTVWSSGVVRYGRVPRHGMTPVRPWTPPANPTPSPAATQKPAPSARPTAGATSPPPNTAQPRSTTTGKPPLAGLARTQRVASSAIALRAVRLAQSTLGNKTLTDVELVRNVWRRAGGGTLPSSRTALTDAGHRVALTDARVGDLVVYGPPASHVGIYVGDGMMISASQSLGKVVLRPVWASSNVRLVRLPG